MKDIIPIWIDCYGIISKKELAERISYEILKNWKSKAIIGALKKLFKSVKPRIRVGEEIEVEFSLEEEEKAFEESLELPQKLASTSKKIVTVVFDEFQEIVEIGQDVLPKMRSAFQKHDKVSHIFVGSKMGMMKKIFRSSLSPFYNFGLHITLNKLPKDEFKEFIRDKFLKTGITIGDTVIERILEITDCHPYYTQMLCHRLWFNAYTSNKEVKSEDVEKTLGELLLEEEDAYITIWDSLTLNQRKVLVAIARGESDLYSADFLRKYRIKRASNVQNALKGLTNKEIVSKVRSGYTITDPFFKPKTMK